MKKLLIAIALLWLIPNVSRGTNLYDIRSTVYAMISADSTNRVLTPARVNVFVNEAIPVLSADTRCIVTTKRQILLTNVEQYYIDNTMVKDAVLDVYIKQMNNGVLSGIFGLVRRDIDEFGRSGETVPNVYDVAGYDLYIHNLPTVSSADDDGILDDSLIIVYAKIGAELTSDTTTTNIPDDYRLALCYKTCELIYGNRRLESIASAYSQMYDKEIAKKRSINPPDSLQRIIPNR